MEIASEYGRAQAVWRPVDNLDGVVQIFTLKGSQYRSEKLVRPHERIRSCAIDHGRRVKESMQEARTRRNGNLEDVLPDKTISNFLKPVPGGFRDQRSHGRFRVV